MAKFKLNNPKVIAAINSHVNKLMASDYKILHDSYTSAIDEMKKNLERKGFELDEDDVWNQISTGPKKPSDGQTNRFDLPLYKNKKPAKKFINVQITGVGDNYELNLYYSPGSLSEYSKEELS